MCDCAAGGRRRPELDDGEDREAPLAPTSARGARAGVREALAAVEVSPSECAEGVAGPGAPCASRAVVHAIAEFIETGGGTGAKAAPRPADAEALPAEDSAEAAAVRGAAAALGCGSESCVLANPRFRRFAAAKGVDRAVEADLRRRFKPEGPRNSTRLLNNFNIDGVLQQWAAAHERFFNIPFCMMDFERAGGSLARVDVGGILDGSEAQDLGPAGGRVRRPCDTFACVLNTDVSSGRGKHWVAVFGDCRGAVWSVEYFNSAGNPPPPPVVRWLEAAATRLAERRLEGGGPPGSVVERPSDGRVETVVLTNTRHQDSQTECGNYALYFIRRRLEGDPPEAFRGQRIPDEAMVEFRRRLFRDA